MLLVVGLGNPGKEYAAHRHNAGFQAIDELARRASAEAFREKFSAAYAKAELAGQPAILLKPLTYMNESGRSVQPAMAFFKVSPAELVVVHDELDLPFGEVRLKVGGGHAGHNGLRSILAHAGGADFARVRMGIGRPPPGARGDVADFVLSPFDPLERVSLPDLVGKAAETVLDVARRGLAAAMNTRNARPKPPKAAEPAPAEVPDAAGGPRPLAHRAK